MEPWVTVAEYSRLSGKRLQSIYRSIERGTIACKKSEAGIKLVSTEGIKDVQPEIIPNTANQDRQSGNLGPDPATGSIPNQTTDEQPKQPVEQPNFNRSGIIVIPAEKRIEQLEAENERLNKRLDALIFTNASQQEQIRTMQLQLNSYRETTAADQTAEAPEHAAPDPGQGDDQSAADQDQGAHEAHGDADQGEEGPAAAAPSPAPTAAEEEPATEPAPDQPPAAPSEPVKLTMKDRLRILFTGRM